MQAHTKQIKVISLLILSLLVISTCFTAAQESKKHIAFTKGHQLPAVVLKNIKGEYVFLSHICYQGEEQKRKPRSVVVLDFMSIDCAPCLKKIPLLVSICKEYEKRGTKLFLVSTDPLSKTERLQEFLSEGKVVCDVLQDPYQVATAKFSVKTVPTTLVISPHGELIEILRGSDENFEKKLRNGLDKALQTAKE